MKSYDSKEDTTKHIERVQELLATCTSNLTDRAAKHDLSKLENPEKPIFDRMTPKLKGSTYGSEEYKSFLAEMRVALDHHYANNSHHPEHYKDGIMGMSLFDLIEMLCDWKAAGERHADGSMARSMEVNKDRFKIPPALMRVLENTLLELGWLDSRLPEEKDTELEQLREWKESAISVLNEWDEVWKALGMPGEIGASKARASLERLKLSLTAQSDLAHAIDDRINNHEAQ